MEKKRRGRVSSIAENRGRPREFDLSSVLDGAVLVFREKGYNSASLSDLCTATSLSTGSIYKAFKDKKGLFLAAFAHYLSQRNEELSTRLAGITTGRDQLEAFIKMYVDSSKGKEGLRGCMVISAMTEITTLDPELALKVREAYKRLELKLLQIFQAGKVDGSLSVPDNPESMICMLLCTLQGMRLAGKVGYVDTSSETIVEEIMHFYV
ncbi:TetR family transcriptional regulator (plasmid) [Pantoea sp. JZ29]|uniref:TetR/AcrR family transcriptional regulator n=1 Tax=Pantoea sp. JZ29 TaxID=2654192 RepID=UPI002B464776|nr:TetR/AcrR family transcriptional regulator [Pantoea sp. JZ29]WRH23368.1 TetR family transcriptional regulator [Pantoea sp. JZ29]